MHPENNFDAQHENDSSGENCPGKCHYGIQSGKQHRNSYSGTVGNPH